MRAGAICFAFVLAFGGDAVLAESWSKNQSNPDEKVSAPIPSYQQEIRSIPDKKRRYVFNRTLVAAEAARRRGAFTEAAEQLEKARLIDRAEFEKRGLGSFLDSVRESRMQLVSEAERQRAAEEERRRVAAAFKDLLNQASEKEKQGALSEAIDLLLKADQTIPNQPEAETLRNRVEEREQTYARARQEASIAEREGRIVEAIGNLKQAEQTNPERYKAENLAAWSDSLSHRLEIQERMRAAEAALGRRQYAEAVEDYDLVLRADPENVMASIQRSRSEFLRLLDRGDELAIELSFPDALQAFELALNENAGQGREVYERMHPHLAKLRAARSPIETNWLKVMRSCDPQQFARERRAVASGGRGSNRRPERPAASQSDSVRRRVLATLNVEPHEAVKILEQIRATQEGDNAEVESWTGVAYARLSLLTVDAKRREELRAKATQHFRRALDLDPQHRLDSRLVPPRVRKLFAEARR